MPPRSLALCLVGFMGAALLAGDPVRPADPVRVSVVIILATDKNADVPKDLECLAREMKKKDPKWTGFRKEKVICESVAVGATEKVELIDGLSVEITVEQGPTKDQWARLKVSPPTLGDITYEAACGKFLPLITKHKTKNDELLIIAVRVQGCKEK
jgi:hypothetical protein